MPTPTQQSDLDAIVIDAVDLLSETRSLQATFADHPLFGGPGRFDDAIARSENLTLALMAAKQSYPPYEP